MALGDPIGGHALADAFGRDRRRPVVLGALKANIGHLGPAAGIAGLLKAIAAVGDGRIPPNLHFRALNPSIALDGLPAAFPTSVTPWPEGDGRRVAGVSSFGFSGTNAHVVLEAAPPRVEPAADVLSGWSVLAVSGRNEAALAEGVRRHLAALTVAVVREPAFRPSLVGRVGRA